MLVVTASDSLIQALQCLANKKIGITVASFLPCAIVDIVMLIKKLEALIAMSITARSTPIASEL
jgi:hypothetical protein